MDPERIHQPKYRMKRFSFPKIILDTISKRKYVYDRAKRMEKVKMLEMISDSDPVLADKESR